MYASNATLDVGHVPVAKVSGMITKSIWMTAIGRVEQAGDFESATSQDVMGG